MNMKKTALSAAITAMMGVSATASAAVIGVDYSGWFTMVNAGGTDVNVNGDSSGGPMYGRRTAVTGTMTFNTSTGAGSGTMVPFSFFGSGNAAATTISFQAVGDGLGGQGPLVLGNMGFNWNSNNGIPTSIVLDASGFFAAVGGGGLTTSSTITGGVLGATDGFLFNFGKFSYTLPMGPVPIATTTFNTTDIGTVVLGTNPSGTLPFTDDGIGGSPMKAGPFPGFNANFDITTLHVNSYVPGGVVPIPAAVWLFGSGLLGLVGIARRKKA
jgi:hypothetical protein